MTELILLRDFMESQIEFWRPIRGFTGYDVSSFGRVRSRLKQLSDGRRFWTEIMAESQQILTPSPNVRDGYMQVGMRTKSRARGQAVLTVHRLVALAFLPNKANLPQVNHRNGIKADNRLDNIEWSTRSSNILHAYSLGLNTPRSGLLNGMSKFTAAQVREIRQLARRDKGTGNGQRLAVKFNCSRSQINRIARRITYKNVAD